MIIADVQAARKPVQTKLSKEFTNAVAAFQKVSRLSAEKQRSHVETQRRRVEELADEERLVVAVFGLVLRVCADNSLGEPRGSVELEQVQVQQQQQAQQ